MRPRAAHDARWGATDVLYGAGAADTGAGAALTGFAAVDWAAIDWSKVGQTETLVIFMGIHFIREITAELMKYGRSADTPAMCVRWGTRPDQQTIVGTLATIAGQIEEADLKPPATVIIGEVVELHGKLAWYEHLPLFGRRIMVTRAREQARRTHGGEVRRVRYETRQRSKHGERQRDLGFTDADRYAHYHTAASSADANADQGHDCAVADGDVWAGLWMEHAAFGEAGPADDPG